VTGYLPDWTNSGGKTPLDIPGIDAEHAQVSTVRATFRKVHFDGRNRARGDSGGGAFDPLPDARNGFGLEGGFANGLFKPVNGKLRFKRCRFSDLPGQAGIFAAQLVGPADPAWTFGPDPVKARVIVQKLRIPGHEPGCIGPGHQRRQGVRHWPRVPEGRLQHRGQHQPPVDESGGSGHRLPSVDPVTREG
jgi:hypothetical protein